MMKLRFGLVGAGTHGRSAVIPAFASCRAGELVAVADACGRHREEVAAAGLKTYASLEEMLAGERLDAVYIATLAEAHCELALTAFAHGLHVVCEKPLAADASEAEAMVEAADRAGRRLGVMFESRVYTANRKIREWIAAGWIGRVEAIHLQSFGKHPTAQPRRTHLLNAAGCLDCGIHKLDLARYWMGGGRWEVIHALGTWFGEEVKHAPHMGILARLDTGVMVTFEDSFSYGRGVDGVPWNFGRNSLVIVGTRGVITDGMAGDNQGFELISDARREWVTGESGGHAGEISKVVDLFCELVSRQGEETGLVATGEDGLEAQRVVDEINQQCVATAPVFHKER